jgi:hypothetical protein
MMPAAAPDGAAPARDVVDEIDQLVDEQMRRERSGWDHSINQARCPHPWCKEPWHGLAITTRMRQMRAKWRSAVELDEEAGGRVTDAVVAELNTYRYDEDDSPICCPGSNFTGEFTPPAAPPPRNLPAATVFTRPAGSSGPWQPVGHLAPEGIRLRPNRERNWRPLHITDPRQLAPEPQWWRCDDLTAIMPEIVIPASAQDVCVGTLDGRTWMDVRDRQPPSAGSWYLRDETAILDLAIVEQLEQLTVVGTATGTTGVGASVEVWDGLVAHAFARQAEARFERLRHAWIDPRNLQMRQIGQDHGMIRMEVRWRQPHSLQAEFRGGRAHNRPVRTLDRLVDEIETPIRVPLSVHDLGFNIERYRRAGFNTITGNWVYRPETEQS